MGKLENTFYSLAQKISEIVFRLYGLFPVLIKPHKSSISKLCEILIQLWSLVLLVVLFLNICWVVRNQEKMFNENSLGKVNDALKFGCVCFAFLIFLIESFFNAKQFKTIFRKFKKFNNELSVLGMNFEKRKAKMIRDYARKFILVVVSQIIVETYIVSTVNWVDFWIANYIPSTACRIRHLQYIYFLHLIRYKVLMLQDEMSIIVESSRIRFLSHDKNVYNNALDRLQTLKNAYGILWDVTFDVNDAFTWSNAANFVQNFVQIGCDCYWSYSSLVQNHFDPLMSSLMICPSIFQIFLVLNQANKIKVEALKIPVLLHKIRKSKKEIDLYKMVSGTETKLRVIFKF
jgi:7tm Chemosensory receptor